KKAFTLVSFFAETEDVRASREMLARDRQLVRLLQQLRHAVNAGLRGPIRKPLLNVLVNCFSGYAAGFAMAKVTADAGKVAEVLRAVFPAQLEIRFQSIN